MFQLREFAAIAVLAFVVNCGSFGIQGSLDFHGALIDSAKDETPSDTTVTVINRMSESTSVPIQTSTISERRCTKSIAILTLSTPSSVALPPSSARSTPIPSGQPHQEPGHRSSKTPYFQQNKSTPVSPSRTPVASTILWTPGPSHIPSTVPKTGSTIPAYVPSTSSTSLEGVGPTESPSVLGSNSTQLVSGAISKRMPSYVFLQLATAVSFFGFCI